MFARRDLAQNSASSSEFSSPQFIRSMPAVLSATRYMTLSPAIIQLQVSLTDALVECITEVLWLERVRNRQPANAHLAGTRELVPSHCEGNTTAGRNGRDSIEVA